jgi:predicted HAD superfamily Cof-like phosphohydrolase
MIKKIRKEWNAKCDVPMNDTPTLLHQDNGQLMARLIYEEVLELMDAIKTDDLIEVADALGDINYLVLGTVNQYGLHGCWDDVTKEIHRSNLTKLQDGKLIKREDGKVLKPDTYEAPQLDKIIKTLQKD